MLEVRFLKDGRVAIAGRLEAAQSGKARAALDRITSPVEVDCAALEYISSSGMALLLDVQKRLHAKSGRGLRLVGLSPHLRDIFRYSGFDQIFEIEGEEAR